MEDECLNWRGLTWQPSQSNRSDVNLVGLITEEPVKIFGGIIRTSMRIHPMAPEYEEVPSDLNVRLFLVGEFPESEMQDLRAASRNGKAINVEGWFVYNPDAEYLGNVIVGDYNILPVHHDNSYK